MRRYLMMKIKISTSASSLVVGSVWVLISFLKHEFPVKLNLQFQYPNLQGRPPILARHPKTDLVASFSFILFADVSYPYKEVEIGQNHAEIFYFTKI